MFVAAQESLSGATGTGSASNRLTFTWLAAVGATNVCSAESSKVTPVYLVNLSLGRGLMAS